MGTNKKAQSELIPDWHQPWSWGSCYTIQSTVNRIENNAQAQSGSRSRWRKPASSRNETLRERGEVRHQGGRTNTCVIQIEVQPICSSQYAEARSN